MSTFLLPFLVFVAVILVILPAYGIWERFFDPRNKAKKARLQAIHNTVHYDGQNPGIAQNALQESAFATWLHQHSATFRQLEQLIQRARSPLTALHLLGILLILFLAVMLLGILRHITPLPLLLLAAAICCTPLLWLSRQAKKRRQAFDDKLPEALDYISRALRAGQSLTSAMSMIGKEFPDPMGHEFRTVADEMAFGIPFKEAITQLSERVQSNDLNFFVVSIMIQHETGGNLTELIDGLSRTIRERMKLRGKIRTLSSEGRASAWILGSIPFVFSAILMLINPGYISVLWTTPQGKNLLLTGAALMAGGIFVLKRIVQIKV